MTKAKYHLQIESQRLGQDTYETYFLMGVNTTADGEVLPIDLLRSSNLEEVRQIAKQQAQSQGCRVVEAL
jgi:hypothetical protein